MNVEFQHIEASDLSWISYAHVQRVRLLLIENSKPTHKHDVKTVDIVMIDIWLLCNILGCWF